MTKSHRQEMLTQRKKRGSKAEMERYVPEYLRPFITPYRSDYCFTHIYHHNLIAQLMSEGFLPISTPEVLLPKLHQQRCVIPLPDGLHVPKSVRKKSKKFSITIDKEFDRVVLGCKKQHGTNCWLYPPLVESFRAIHNAGKLSVGVFQDGKHMSPGRQCSVRIHSIEIWNEQTGALAGGELGYTVGSIYTSLTGFSQDSAGSVQLAALGRMLSRLGFSLWDLGMEMEYKKGLGSQQMPRREYVDHVQRVREQDLLLPPKTKSFNARSLIDQTERLLPTCTEQRDDVAHN